MCKRYIFPLLLLVQGCVRIPDHELLVAQDAALCERAAESALASGVLEEGEWPEKQWWKAFDDPTLDYLIEQALSSSPTLARAEANLKQACEKAKEKRANLFPEIDFLATDLWAHLSRYGLFRGFAPSVYPVMINDTVLGFTFSYEFDFWGKNRAIFNAALGQAAAAAAERMQAELILTTSIAYTYIELQFIMEKRELQNQIEANTREIEKIQMKREKNALDPAIVSLQSSYNSENSSAPIVEYDEQIQIHIHELKALSGMGQDADVAFDLKPLNATVFSLPECLSLNLISRRPDLAAGQARMEAAAKEIDAAKTNFYPDINIKALVGLESAFWQDLFLGRSYTGVLSPALNLPIFTAGRIKANLMDKVAQFNEAVAAYNELILSAAKEVANILSSLGRYQKEIEIRKRAWRINGEQEKLYQKKFDHALENRIAVLSAQNQTLQSEISWLEMEYGKQLANIELVKALGGGYE